VIGFLTQQPLVEATHLPEHHQDINRTADQHPERIVIAKEANQAADGENNQNTLEFSAKTF
jgi:hypothetical protein